VKRAPTWRYTYAIRLEIVMSPCQLPDCPNHTPAQFDIELFALTSSIALATVEGKPLSGSWS